MTNKIPIPNDQEGGWWQLRWFSLTTDNEQPTTNNLQKIRLHGGG
jgi:hypothetical protein